MVSHLNFGQLHFGHKYPQMSDITFFIFCDNWVVIFKELIQMSEKNELLNFWVSLSSFSLSNKTVNVRL